MTLKLDQYKSMSLKMPKQLIVPALAKLIGLEECIILQQIHYWLEKSGKLINGKLWIYNTLEDWKEQFQYWSSSKIYKIIKSLKDLNLIFIDKKNSSKGNQTNWYAINYDLLCKKLENIPHSKKSISKDENSFVNQCFEIENDLREKNFAFIQNEKPFCQNDKIYIGNTKNNLQKNNYLSKSKKSVVDKKNITDPKVVGQKENFSEKEMEICKQMIQVWNEVFTKESDKISFSERRGKKLIALWSNLMEEKIEKWKDFCLKINSSKFLMGEKDGSKFKAYCDWLLQENIAQKIFIGEYGVGDRVPEIKREAKAQLSLKLREERIAKQLEEREVSERQEQINNISNTLQEQAIKELESQWSEDEKQKVHEEFGIYLKKEFGWIFSEYKLKGIDAPLVSTHYDFFIIKKYFNNDSNVFLNKAKEMIEMVILK